MEQPAPRMHIPIDSITYEQWKELRAPYIGASDVGALLAWFESWPASDAPWGSALRIYHRIGGSLDYDEEEFLLDQYAPAECGREFEDGIGRMYAKRFPEMEVEGKSPTWQHPTIDWLVATPDLLVVHPERGPGVAQFKLATSNGRKKWANGLPLYVEAQVQLEMEVMGREWAHVFAVVDATTKCFYVERSADYFQRIVEAGEHFRAALQAGDVAAFVDGSDDVTRTLKETEPEELKDGETLLSSEVSARLETYEKLMEERRGLDGQLAEIKNSIRHEMAEHRIGFSHEDAMGGGWSVSYKAPATPRLNTKKLKEEHPEIWEACAEPSSRRLTIRRRKP